MIKRIAIIVFVLFLLFEFIMTVSPGQIQFIKPNALPTPPILQNETGKLQITDLQIGTGKEVKPGDKVVMNYRGTLTNGTEFDSSYKRNEPFETTIGIGQVIKGWDQGIPGMKIGGKRKLVIPPDLAYGKQGAPPTIPPDATLIFEVELVNIK